MTNINPAPSCGNKEEGEKWWRERFEKKYSLSIPNKYGTKRNPFLMFDCDGGIVNMPYEELKSFIAEALQSQKSKLEQEILDKMPREKVWQGECLDSYIARSFNLCLQECKAVINTIFKK